jgi:hypothetical protein
MSFPKEYLNKKLDETASALAGVSMDGVIELEDGFSVDSFEMFISGKIEPNDFQMVHA